MSCKRAFTDQDPDYENNLSNDQKRLKVIEKDNKEATIRKIEQIITNQFNHELTLKEGEVKEIDDRLYQTLKMLDQLRICVITSYYSFDKQCETAFTKISGYQPPIHPAVRKYIGKRPKLRPFSDTDAAVTHTTNMTPNLSDNNHPVAKATTSTTLPSTASSVPVLPQPLDVENIEELGSRASRFKIKKRIIVGNVSKYIPVDKREERDQSTHKWMIYVRGTKEEPYIESFVKKVWFFLHPSYRPNDLVEVNQPPFHLTRRGWGEFPVRTQLHFHDVRNKRVDIIHTLKLDKTYTGLQTLGAETVVDIFIYKPELVLGNGKASGELNTTDSATPDMGGYVISHDHGSETQSLDCESVTTDNGEVESETLYSRNLQRDTKSPDDTFVSSFINDHGAYFSPVNVDLVKSEHSYQAEYPPLENSGDAGALNASVIHNTGYEIPRKIKEEPPDELESCPSNLDTELVISSSCMNNYRDVNHGTKFLTKAKYSSGQLVGSDDIVKYSESLCLKPNNLSNSKLPLFSQATTPSFVLKSESGIENEERTRNEIVLPDASNSPAIPPSQLLAFSEGSSVNNSLVPQNYHLYPQDSFKSLSATNTCVSTVKPAVSSRSAIDTMQLEKLKSSSQSQCANGVTTFVKCVDKQGNLFLIPLTMFLKMNPGAQNTVSPNLSQITTISSPASSSLLKASRTIVNLDASTSAASSAPVVMVSGPSSNMKTATEMSSILTTTVSTSQNLTAPKFRAPSPSIIALASAPNSQRATAQQSLLLSSSKMSHVLQGNKLFAPNSVSVTSDISKLKKLSSFNNTGSTKPMVSCLIKNRLSLEKTLSALKHELRLDIDTYDSMDQIIQCLGKRHPLITANIDRIKHPFCARSVDEFLNWNVGKRHAAEWQRARAVRNTLMKSVQDSQNWKTEDIWSVKQLFFWYRRHGYSPMKISETDDSDLIPKPKLEVNFCTYSDAKEVLEQLWQENESVQESLQDSDEDEEVDVVTFEESTKKQRKSPEKPVSQPMIRFPSTLQGEFVRDTAEQIGIKLTSEFIEKDTVAPVAEEVIVTALKQFVEDIMSTSVAIAFEESGNKRCPRELSLTNVGKALCKLPFCDFLTNKYLGTKISKQHFINFGNVKL